MICTPNVAYDALFEITRGDGTVFTNRLPVVVWCSDGDQGVVGLVVSPHHGGLVSATRGEGLDGGRFIRFMDASEELYRDAWATDGS